MSSRHARSSAAIAADLSLAEKETPPNVRKVALLAAELSRAKRRETRVSPDPNSRMGSKALAIARLRKEAAEVARLHDRWAFYLSCPTGFEDRPSEVIGGPAAVFGFLEGYFLSPDKEFRSTRVHKVRRREGTVIDCNKDAKAFFSTLHSRTDAEGHQIWLGSVGAPFLIGDNGKPYRNPRAGCPVIAFGRDVAHYDAGAMHYRLYKGMTRGFIPKRVCSNPLCVAVDHWELTPIVFTEDYRLDRD